MVGPGARKPSVGEGIESRRPLFCSGITTLHSLFIYFFFLSFIFTFASILVCVNNNNNNNNKPRIVHTTIITRVRAGEVGGAHYPKWRRSLLIHAETRDFHSRRGMGARTIALGRCTPLTIVDQFGIKISGFTPSFEALGRLLKKKKKKMTKIRNRV